MLCKNCGKEIPDKALFCPYCGTNQALEGAKDAAKVVGAKVSENVDALSEVTEKKLSEIEADVSGAIREAEAREQAELMGVGGNAEANKDHGGKISESLTDLLLKIAAGIVMAVFAYFAIRTAIGVFKLIPNVFSLLRHLRFSRLFTSIFSIIKALVPLLVTLVAHVFVIATAYTIGFKRKDSQTTELLVANGIAAVVEVLAYLAGLILAGRYFAYYIGFKSKFMLFLPVLIALLGFVAFFVILYLSGRKTITAMDTSNGKNIIADAFNAFMEAIGGDKLKEKAAASKAAAAAASAVAVSTGMQTMQPTGATRAITTNRGILKYIIFTILTCGIYSFFFIHGVARDVNEMCKDDGNKVGGLFAYIVLSIITCGIYPIYWEYKIANRLQETAPKYGTMFSESGSSVLLWHLVGLLLCGIGPFIAMNIVIRNTNRLAKEYNRVNGLNQ